MVDELFLMKKLKEVEFEDFDVSVDDYLQKQTDLDKIKEYYKDDANMDAQLTEVAKEIFDDKIYQITTVRGAINAVLGKVREQVYAKLSENALEEKIEEGDYIIETGTILGAYDFPIRKDDGSTFTKNFMVLSTDDGIIEITCIGDKIGPRKRAVPIPFMKRASYVINPKKFTRANGVQDVDYAAMRVGEVSDEFDIITEHLAAAENTEGGLWDIDRIVDEFPPEGQLKRGDWIWFKGIIRNIEPFPIFEGREMTGQYHHLVTYDKYNEPTYAFNLSARGKFFDDEAFYPTIRLQPTEIGYTQVEWDGVEELVTALTEAQNDMDPSDQFKTLDNEITDRVFYALVKVAKIEQRKGQSRQEGREGETVDRFFINLNAVYVRITDEIIPWKPQTNEEEEEEEEKPAKAPAKKSPPKKKPATPAKATAWKAQAVKQITEWRKAIPDADFETLVDNDAFDDDVFKGVDEAALKTVFEDLIKDD